MTETNIVVIKPSDGLNINSLQTEEKGVVAHKYHEEVVKVVSSIKNNFVYLGKLFWDIATEKLYITMGYDTIESYISSPEIDMQRTWFYELMRVHKRFVIDLGCDEAELSEIGVSKLSVLGRENLDLSRDKPEQLSEWLESGKTLSKLDLIKKIQGNDEIIDGNQNSDEIVNLSPGYYRVMRMTQSSFGDFTPIGRKTITVGKDSAGLILRIV